MRDFRSNSYIDSRMQLEVYRGGGGEAAPHPSGLRDLRSYSSSYPSSFTAAAANGGGYDFRDTNFNKGKDLTAATASSRKSGKWAFSDPEFQRKRRVASYKVYSVEGRVKGSIRRSFRWFKDKYTQVLYG